MDKEKNYIEELFTDALPVDEKAIVEALKPFIVVRRDTKEIYFRDEKKITVKDKILVYGLAKKLLKIRGFVDTEAISAIEIHEKTGIKKGSVDPTFKALKKKLLVGKGKNYEIPNYKVGETVNRLKNLGKSK